MWSATTPTLHGLPPGDTDTIIIRVVISLFVAFRKCKRTTAMWDIPPRVVNSILAPNALQSNTEKVVEFSLNERGVLRYRGSTFCANYF